MTITLSNIVSAWNAIQKIRGLDLPPNVLFELFNLAIAIEKPYNFVLQEEEKFAKLTGGVSYNGKFLFDDPQNATIFQAKQLDIKSLSISLNIVPVKIDCSYIPSDFLDSVELNAIHDFVTFSTCDEA